MGKDYYDYINVGSWDNRGLKIDDDEIWPNNDAIIKSVCSEPCDKGQIKVNITNADTTSGYWCAVSNINSGQVTYSAVDDG